MLFYMLAFYVRFLFFFKKGFLLKINLGTSLVVQWLRLRLPKHGVWVQSLVKELRSHMPRGQKTKT